MPHVNVKISSGLASFHYTISTPTSTSASYIDKSLPTVIFLHSAYIAQVIFHTQFSDPQLRRFNLIAIDTRGLGGTVADITQDYCREEAAEDIFKVMEALELPACHFFGLAMGASISLQLSIAHPQKVLSLYLVSPLPMNELPDVIEGRQEIYDTWIEGIKNPSNIDQWAIRDAVLGSNQLAYNDVTSKLIDAINAVAVIQALNLWHDPDPDKCKELHLMCVEFFQKQTPYSQSSLANISCPVKLVHCSEDIAYPVQHAEELMRALKDASVRTQIEHVEHAGHFGTVTHSEQINRSLHDFILSNSNGKTVPPAPTQVTSPMEEGLIKAGWSQEDSDDD